MLKAILFDMDGVLVDSEPVHFAANYKMMKDNFGIELDYDLDYKGYIGSTIEKIWKFIREKYKLFDYEWNELMDMAEDVLKEMLKKGGYPEVEGVKALVENLSDNGFMLAVASSSPMEKIVNNLDNLGIRDEFSVLVSGMEIENPKPAPDIFLLAAEKLGVNSDECLVIEDSKNGVIAAKAAQMACLGFINENSGNQDLSKADYLCESFLGIDESFIRMIHNHTFNIPWKVMETERLIIREVELDDIDSLINVYKHPDITKYMEGLFERDEEVKYIKEYVKNIYGFYNYGMWAICLKDGTIIGRAGIEYLSESGNGKDELYGEKTFFESSYEEGVHMLGYVLAKEYQGFGYAYEACKAILDYAKEELMLSKVCVRIHRNNEQSLKLAKKLGFKFDIQK